MSTGPATTSSFLVMAVRPDGSRAYGFRQAGSPRALADQLRRERLVPVRTVELPKWAGSTVRFSLKEQAEINTQLAQLLGRGVPLVEAMDVVASAVSNKNRPVVARMRELVAGGASFADSCERVGVFDRVTVAVYRAAERTGDLSGAAKQLALTQRRQLAISGKAATLMIYPAIVLTISLAVSVMMLTLIVPRIGKSLVSAGMKLPTYSKITMAVGEFIGDQFLWICLALLGLGVVAFACRAAILQFLQRVMRSTPFIRDVVLAQESTRFFTVMAAMTRSGVPLADGLGVAIGAVGHPILRTQLGTLRTKLIEGGILRNLIDNVTALPLTTRRLLIAAERSGDLETAFDTLAIDMAEEVDKKSQRLLSVLEPALIVFMFLVVGSLLLSIMIPMIQAASKSV
jgi:type II secretory pathway component PulF